MFPPEFINRLDEIIYFNSLSQEDLIKIIDVEIKKMTPRFEEIG
jgi:ATP-dependent Clp protease ATP-binding subunit ClpA